MRFLNKIILIESANVRYTEVNVDGNVHFIGTQGVGKSTLLRALLFFYNANQLKLGIPVGKKSFVEFYFPYQNSYIIYEVVRETGIFCVMVFKSQGRICFRFLDTAYHKDHFIDAEGRILETWDKIKLAFGRSISYSRKIETLEEYRNILYGNSQGLGAEFKKYSILESKQYQNIPRAIQHVFLNYKVESDFIKETIIKSLNEDEIKIDLTNYSHHLKNFDSQLNDIKKWTDKTKNGEILVLKQALQVSSVYLAIKMLEHKKHQLFGNLCYQVSEVRKHQPKSIERLDREELKKADVEQKISDIDHKYDLKKGKIRADINVFQNKLDEAKKKSAEYSAMDIASIISRVTKKADWENEITNLIHQKTILEARFTDIKHKYEAQINVLINQNSSFENAKQNQINEAYQSLYLFKEALSKEYEKLIEEIRNQHADELLLAKNLVDEKQSQLTQLEITKAGIRHKRFFEAEISNSASEINLINEKIRITEGEIKQKNIESEGIRRQWELERERAEELASNKTNELNTQTAALNLRIAEIAERIDKSKDSFYGWLNKEYPSWENTIGKVIDEDTVLFHAGLSPEKVNHTDLSLFGVKIDLSEINKTVKTVADYEKEKKDLFKQIAANQSNLSQISVQLNADLENLRRKHQVKISKSKDTVLSNEYTIEQSKLRLNEITVALEEFKKRAEAEKKKAIEEIDFSILKANDEKLLAEQNSLAVEGDIKKKIVSKTKEKDKKIENETKKVNETIASIQVEIKDKKTDTARQVDELKAKQTNELNSEGADTKRIDEIDSRISVLKFELNFIDQNRDRVAEYNKDKRELFDKVDHFKNQIKILDSQLENEQSKCAAQKLKLIEELTSIKEQIEAIKLQLSNFKTDLDKFELFQLTDCYKSFDAVDAEASDQFKTNTRCLDLIDELNSVYYKGIDRYRELQEAINKFNGNFSSQNTFSFKTNLVDQGEYFQFAEDLKEFIDEDKISVYEKRVNEQFASIIKLVSKETTEILSKEGEIQNIISEINKDFVKRNFAGVIKSIELRLVTSGNKVVQLLSEIKKFNDENINELGVANLFSSSEQTREAKNKKAIGLLTQLVKEISDYKRTDINLSDSFELEFKIIENDNDTNWVQNLANVGSDGTDVLVKAMINIMLLNVFKEGATKNRFKDFKLHCMMDEIGKLHPTNVRGILKFANDRNINLINSSPQSFDALAYRYTYKLAKDDKSVTIINRLITNNRDRE